MDKATQVSAPCNLINDHAYDATYAQKEWGFKTISCFDKLSHKKKTSVVCHNMNILKHLPSEIKTSIIRKCIKNNSDDYVGLHHLDFYVTRSKKISSQDNGVLKYNKPNPIQENNAGESSKQTIKFNDFAGSSKLNSIQENNYKVKSRRHKSIQENNDVKTSKKNYVQEDNIDASSEQDPISNNIVVDSSKQYSNQENHVINKDSRKSSRTKRAHVEVVGSKESEEDENWTPSKKKSREQKTRTRTLITNPVTNIEPELPEEIKSKIVKLNGRNIKWVITKRLFPTDVSQNNDRFSMPLSQIDINFLSSEEKEILDREEWIAVRLVAPYGELSERRLRKWTMKKPDGKINITYNIRTGWYKDVEVNGLEAGQLVHVWSFREGSNLSFALARVDE